MTDWIRAHDTALWWLAGASAVAFIASLIVVPLIVVRIPDDYFAHGNRHRAPWADWHPVVRAILLLGKNALGLLFILVGIAMLVLPGQGILTMAIGILLLDFPGKYWLERWVVTRRPVLRSINWLRKRAARAPLDVR